jgi:hypothetical protein
VINYTQLITKVYKIIAFKLAKIALYDKRFNGEIKGTLFGDFLLDLLLNNRVQKTWP